MPSDTNLALAASLTLAEPATVVRDSVWRSIPLQRPELELIDTEPYQRLRRVQQLGLISLVFPGANHTRFEHSIGVYHLAKRVLIRLLRLGECPRITDEDSRVLLAAALLHDLGHYPFSHAIGELEMTSVRPHEQISQELIVASPVSDVLRDRWRVDPERVAGLLSLQQRPGIDGLLQDIISGTLDVDKLDYLIRDARHCNVPYGEIDVDRIIEALRVQEDSIGRHRLALSEKGVGPYQSLVFARYMMYFNVYWHHTCRICSVMVLRAAQDALSDGMLQPGELERLDDGQFLGLLHNRATPGSSAADLGSRIARRRLFKRVFEYVDGDDGYTLLSPLKQDSGKRRELEIEWSRALVGSESKALGHEVLIDIPEPKSMRIEMSLVRKQGPDGDLVRAPWDHRAGLDDGVLSVLQRRLRRIRVVVADDELRGRAIGHERELLRIATEFLN